MQYTLNVPLKGPLFLVVLVNGRLLAINVISQGYGHNLATLLNRFNNECLCILFLPIWQVYTFLYKIALEYTRLLARWSVPSPAPRVSR